MTLFGYKVTNLRSVYGRVPLVVLELARLELVLVGEDKFVVVVVVMLLRLFVDGDVDELPLLDKLDDVVVVDRSPLLLDGFRLCEGMEWRRKVGEWVKNETKITLVSFKNNKIILL